MRRYLLFSFAGHGAFLGVLLAFGALLSKPRMGYYAIEILGSLPSGPAGGRARAPSVTESVKPQQAAPHETLRDSIRVLDKKHKTVTRTPLKAKHVIKAVPRASQRPAPSVSTEGESAEGKEGAGGGSGAGGGGAGIVAEAGPAFPYPWYLKAIADRLDKQWHPPQEFQANTTCVVAFVIHTSGEVTGAALEKPSGDSFFDQLALRAVLYANPLPPLPGGYVDSTLQVHMTFVGKPY